MSYLDRKDLLSADLRNRVISTKGAIKYYNTDKNIAYIYMKLVTENEDGAEKQIQKDEASNYNVTITVKKRGNDIKEVVGVLSDDIVDETCAIYKFILPSEFTDQVGECVCETVVKNNDKELVMNTFVYSVKPDMLTGLNGEIITDPDFPVLKKLIEEVKETAQTVNNIDNVNVSDTKTYSNKKIEEKFNGVSSQIKDIAKDLLLEGERLYLKKLDGTKMGLGVVLPTGVGEVSYITPEDFGAVGDGITDDYNAFKELMEYLDTVTYAYLEFGKNKVYKINRYIGDGISPTATRFIIQNKNYLQINGNDSKIVFNGNFQQTAGDLFAGGYYSTKHTVGFTILGCNNVNINNLEIDGQSNLSTIDNVIDSESADNNGFVILACNNVKLSNIYSHNFTCDAFIVGDGDVNIDNSVIRKLSENVQIDNCKFEYGARNSVTVGCVKNVSFNNCIIRNAGLSNGSFPMFAPGLCVDIEPDFGLGDGLASEPTNITFYNCDISNGKGGILASPQPFVYNVTFDTCLLKDYKGDKTYSINIDSQNTHIKNCEIILYKELYVDRYDERGTTYFTNNDIKVYDCPLIVEDTDSESPVIFENNRIRLYQTDSSKTYYPIYNSSNLLIFRYNQVYFDDSLTSNIVLLKGCRECIGNYYTTNRTTGRPFAIDYEFARVVHGEIFAPDTGYVELFDGSSSYDFKDKQYSNVYQSLSDNRLETNDKTIVGAINEVKSYVSNGKVLIASALTDKGIPTLATETFESMADKILQITGGDVVVPPEVNKPPVISNINSVGYFDGTFELTWVCTDDENDSLTFELGYGESFVRINPVKSVDNYTYHGSGLSVGDNTRVIKVSDGTNTVSSSSFVITIPEPEEEPIPPTEKYIRISPTSYVISDDNVNSVTINFVTDVTLTNLKISTDGGNTYTDVSSFTQTSCVVSIANMQNGRYSCLLKGTYGEEPPIVAEIPVDGLHTWVVSNEGTSTTLWSDKSGKGNNLVLENFASTSTSGFNGGKLMIPKSSYERVVLNANEVKTLIIGFDSHELASGYNTYLFDCRNTANVYSFFNGNGAINDDTYMGHTLQLITASGITNVSNNNKVTSSHKVLCSTLDNNFTGRCSLFNKNTGSESLGCSVKCVIAYNRVLNDEEKIQVYNYIDKL